MEPSSRSSRRDVALQAIVAPRRPRRPRPPCATASRSPRRSPPRRRRPVTVASAISRSRGTAARSRSRPAFQQGPDPAPPVGSAPSELTLSSLPLHVPITRSAAGGRHRVDARSARGCVTLGRDAWIAPRGVERIALRPRREGHLADIRCGDQGLAALCSRLDAWGPVDGASSFRRHLDTNHEVADVDPISLTHDRGLVVSRRRLTYVPFVLLRSVTMKRPSRNTRRACRFETFPLASIRSLPCTRPMLSSDCWNASRRSAPPFSLMTIENTGPFAWSWLVSTLLPTQS